MISPEIGFTRIHHDNFRITWRIDQPKLLISQSWSLILVLHPTQPRPDPDPTRTLTLNHAISHHISASRHQIFTKFETETPWTFQDTSQSWSRTPAPVRNIQHPPNLQQCHQSLRVILMLSNSTDVHQILNLASLGQVQTIQNFTKDTNPSQECP